MITQWCERHYVSCYLSTTAEKDIPEVTPSVDLSSNQPFMIRMNYVFFGTVFFALITLDTWANKIAESEGTWHSSSTLDSEDTASYQDLLTDGTHQLGKLQNILTNVNQRIKDILHGGASGSKASKTAKDQKMLVPQAKKLRHVPTAVGKAGKKIKSNQSNFGRALSSNEPPPESPNRLNTKEKGDRTHRNFRVYRKQYSKNSNLRTKRHKEQKNGKEKSKKGNRVPAHMYKKMIEYCQTFKTRKRDKTKEYYKTKGCKDPRKCESYTEIHHITRDYESVKYRGSAPSICLNLMLFKTEYDTLK